MVAGKYLNQSANDFMDYHYLANVLLALMLFSFFFFKAYCNIKLQL